jgi:hypothetical protein
MSTDDNNDDNDTTSKIDCTSNFDPSAKVIKPIEDHSLFHLAREKGPSCDRQENAMTGIYKTAMDNENFFEKTYFLAERFWDPGFGKEVWDLSSGAVGHGNQHGTWQSASARGSTMVLGNANLKISSLREDPRLATLVDFRIVLARFMEMKQPPDPKVRGQRRFGMDGRATNHPK